jgi:YVTN family beta-propeller protein
MRAPTGLALEGGVKTFALHPERLFVELYIVEDAAIGWAGARAEISDVVGAIAQYDLGVDPLSEPVEALDVPLGGIAPEGVARLRIGFDIDPAADALSFRVVLTGRETTRTAASSAPIAITPDGAEAWATFADGDVLSVIDVATDARIAQVPAVGRPTSVAITPDGELVLATCADCNQVVVVDRARREVVQILGEEEGIGRDPRHVVIAPDGSRAWVSAAVGDTVTVLERVGDRFRVRRTIPVGRRPAGLSVTPDGTTVYVAHFLPRGPVRDNEGWVSVIDGATDEVVDEIALRDDGNEAEAECLSQVEAFGGFGGAELSFEAVPTQLAGVFLDPGGRVGWVPGLRVAGFPIFEGDPTPLGFQFLTVGANSPAMLFPLDTREPRDAGFRKVGAVVDITDRDEAFLRCVPALDDAEAVRVRPGATADERVYAGVTIPSQATFLDETGASRFVGYSRGGRRVLVLSYLADELAILDGASASPVARRHAPLSGSNPLGLAVTPDGTKAYVVYESSTFASVLDLTAYASPALPRPAVVPYRLDPGAAAGQGAAIITFLLLTRTVRDVPDLPPIAEVAQVPLVDADPLDPQLRRGKVLFTSSNPDKYPTLTRSRQAACAACHPDGGNDGSAWSTMEGERRTIALWGGVGERGWLHASATHAGAVDFATTIVRERLGGTGLSPDDEAALVRWVEEGIPARQRPAVDATKAARGAELFARHCAVCHDGARDDGDPRLEDVGTATDWASVTLGAAYTRLFSPTAKRVLDALRGDRDLGPGDVVEETLGFTARPMRPRGAFKIPALTNTWENAVWMHDARFDDLRAVVDYFVDWLGAPLDDAERDALVEHLKTL